MVQVSPSSLDVVWIQALLSGRALVFVAQVQTFSSHLALTEGQTILVSQLSPIFLSEKKKKKSNNLCTYHSNYSEVGKRFLVWQCKYVKIRNQVQMPYVWFSRGLYFITVEPVMNGRKNFRRKFAVKDRWPYKTGIK